MIELKKSYGKRRSGKGSEGKVTVDYHCPPENVDRVGITLRFDSGSPNQHDCMEVVIDANDFASLFTEMIDHNRRAFLDAVANALLAHPDSPQR